MATQPLATPTPAPVPQRALRRWDWILGAFFLAIYWALALGVGVRGIAAVTGIAVMAIAFFFPKPGIYALAWILLAEVTFLIISSVAKVAANRGDPNTELGWQIIWDTFAALAALGVMGALWLAVAFRARLTGFRWRLTPFEESLAWLGILTILWIPVGLGNDVDIFYMAFDVQLMFYYPTAILISRAFAPKDWPPFFVWVVAGVFVHWLVMLADLAFGGVFVNPQFITDVVRHTIGGSPDLS
ncbi:MAG TPA: hypothetical protein VEI97_13390, partial [bacterium]|nr:hypothetical protein [bacterium]